MSKDREELRIARAKALCAASGDDWFREGPKGLMGAYGPLVDADTSAIEAAGFVVLPRAPTPEMITDGLIALVRRIGEWPYKRPTKEQLEGTEEWSEQDHTQHLLHIGGMMRSGEEVIAAYRAMINAYSPKTSGGDTPPTTEEEGA